MITAKMRCWDVPAKQGNTEQIELSAVTDNTGINKKWAAATPSGQLRLGIDNPSAQGFFQKDKEYIITIREAKPGE